MKQRIITLVAASTALALSALAATPAIAFDDGYNNGPYVDQGSRQRGWVGYGDEDYGRRGPYGYGGPDYEAGVRDIAICPPGYHLGRSGTLCWPN